MIALVILAVLFVYQGPQIVTDLNTGLAQRLADDGYGSVSDAVGAEAHNTSMADRAA